LSEERVEPASVGGDAGNRVEDYLRVMSKTVEVMEDSDAYFFVGNKRRTKWVRIGLDGKVLATSDDAFGRKVELGIADTLRGLPPSGALGVFVAAIAYAGKHSLIARPEWRPRIAGDYLRDAKHFATEYTEASLAIDAARAKHKDNLLLAALAAYGLNAQARRTCFAALSLVFSCEEAAFFEMADQLLADEAHAEELGKASYPGKWTLLADAVGVGLPEDLAKRMRRSLMQAIKSRIHMVHVPARVKKSWDGMQSIEQSLMPSPATLTEWIAEVGDVVGLLADTFGLENPLA
jgi:hypothetical protein